MKEFFELKNENNYVFENRIQGGDRRRSQIC